MSEFDTFAVDSFKEYLRIKSVHPNPDYESCAKFLINMAEKTGMKYQLIEIVKGKPIIILTQEGRDPTLPALLLNSHMDVVLVTPEKWTKEPFSAYEDEKGNIYARGSQDMKSVGMAQLHSVYQLVKEGFKPTRTIHMSFVPDEEIGGEDGMKAFVKTEAFKNLNVGFALDEGCPAPLPAFVLFNGERFIWSVKITTSGNAGHGSIFVQDTAVEKLHRIMDKILTFRSQQMANLAQSSDPLATGRITSVNITMLEAGKQLNVIPDEASASLNIRVADDYGDMGMEKLIKEWIGPYESTTTVTFLQKHPFVPPTSIDSPWYKKIIETLTKDGQTRVETAIFPGATDSRYIREVGVPAIGFTPFMNTTLLLHDHDEYLNKQIYLDGIKILKRVIANLAEA